MSVSDSKAFISTQLIQRVSIAKHRLPVNQTGTLQTTAPAAVKVPGTHHTSTLQTTSLLVAFASFRHFLPSFFPFFVFFFQWAADGQRGASPPNPPPGGVLLAALQGDSLLNGLTFSCLLVCSTSSTRSVRSHRSCREVTKASERLNAL